MELFLRQPAGRQRLIGIDLIIEERLSGPEADRLIAADDIPRHRRHPGNFLPCDVMVGSDGLAKLTVGQEQKRLRFCVAHKPKRDQQERKEPQRHSRPCSRAGPRAEAVETEAEADGKRRVQFELGVDVDLIGKFPEKVGQCSGGHNEKLPSRSRLARACQSEMSRG